MDFFKTTAEAKDYARKIFSILHQGIHSLPITEPEVQGNEYFTFLADDHVVRIARNQTVSDAIQKEADIMTALRGKVTAAYVPEVVMAEPKENLMVIKRFAGINLTAKRLRALSPEQRAQVAEQIGQFMAQMHQAMPQDPLLLRTDAYKWDKELDKLHLAFANASGADSARLLRAREYMSHHSSVRDAFVMTHGDLKPGNILYSDADQIAVVDFMNAKPNFAHHDFISLSHAYPKEFVSQIAQAYNKACLLYTSDAADE